MIAGDGELKGYLEKLIDMLKLKQRIILLGYRTDISKLCNAADIFVLPSVHEGLSVALMEAMGCGKPVIASRIRGNVDLIDDNKGGFLVDTYDVDSYVRSIKTLIKNADLRNTMGNYNINKVKMFDVEIVKKQIIELFNEDKI